MTQYTDAPLITAPAVSVARQLAEAERVLLVQSLPRNLGDGLAMPLFRDCSSPATVAERCTTQESTISADTKNGAGLVHSGRGPWLSLHGCSSRPVSWLRAQQCLISGLATSQAQRVRS